MGTAVKNIMLSLVFSFCVNCYFITCHVLFPVMFCVLLYATLPFVILLLPMFIVLTCLYNCFCHTLAIRFSWYILLYCDTADVLSKIYLNKMKEQILFWISVQDCFKCVGILRVFAFDICELMLIWNRSFKYQIPIEYILITKNLDFIVLGEWSLCCYVCWYNTLKLLKM